MANKKSAAAQAAAQQAAPAGSQNGNADPNLNTIVTNMKSGSLSQDGKAITANLVQKRWVEGDDIPDGIRHGAGVIVDALLGDIIVTSIAQGNSVFAGIIARDENKYLKIKAALAEQGISLPEFKALPAPTDEMMKAAGVQLLPAEVANSAAVIVTAENVDKKAVEKKKKEIEAVKNAVDNPSKVENEEQLKSSLTAMLVKPITDGPDGIDARVNRTIGFYRGYLSIQANKIEDAEEKKSKLNEIKNTTLVDLLDQIAKIVGSCPFVIHGGAHMLRERVEQTGNPIDAFCLYRRTATSVKNGTADDQQVADIVRTLIVWSCNGRIADLKANIKTSERLIKKNEEEAKGKDAVKAKSAEAAIRLQKKEIDKYNVEIETLQKYIDETVNPSFDIVDGLVENYNGDEKSEVYKLSRRVVGNIMKTYYPTVDIKKADETSMLANVQQRAGVILNMFHSPLDQNQSYSEANVGEIELVKEEAAE